MRENRRTGRQETVMSVPGSSLPSCVLPSWCCFLPTERVRSTTMVSRAAVSRIAGIGAGFETPSNVAGITFSGARREFVGSPLVGSDIRARSGYSRAPLSRGDGVRPHRRPPSVIHRRTECFALGRLASSFGLRPCAAAGGPYILSADMRRAFRGDRARSAIFSPAQGLESSGSEHVY